MRKNYSGQGFLTAKQVGRVFGRSYITVRKWVAKKKIIPALKVGMLNLFDVKDVMKLAEREKLFLVNPPPAFLLGALEARRKRAGKQKNSERRPEAFLL